MNLFLPSFYVRHSLSPIPRFRHQRTSSTRVQDAVWQPTFWASVIAIMTILCCDPPVTCSTSTLASSWATPRCLAASKGENEIYCSGRVCVYANACQMKHALVRCQG